ncbi:alpha/beta hydrolase [candidate division KSB1 bacterium]|nr:alpha/beta hydrolase [candidate division KSB1 bacterium]
MTISIKKIFIFLLIVLFGMSCKEQQNTDLKPPRGYPNTFWLKAGYLMGQVKLVNLKPDVPPEIQEFKNLVYKTVDSDTLKLDIYQPANLTRPAPCLVFIHGGAWKGGNKQDYLVYLLDFAKQGYITSTISYRFSQQAHFPAAVLDVKCAIKWLKAHADEYGIDPDKMAVIGGSAGGHLAMMIGYTSDVAEFNGECEFDSVECRVQAIVNLYGPTDLTTDFAKSKRVVHKFIGGKYDEAPEAYLSASPITHISADDPPTLIFHGTIDDVVPVHQSDLLKAKLDELGVPNEYHRLKGWPHTMDAEASVNAYCQFYMNRFFRQTIPFNNGEL